MNVISRIADTFERLGKCLKKRFNWWLYEASVGEGFATLIVIVIILVYIVNFWVTSVNREMCLDSDSPRRWRDYICEERIEGEWLEINHLHQPRYYYNDKAAN